jgi:hypothetical protein
VGELQTCSPFQESPLENNALKADFLDLTLEIKNGHIVTKTYEKPTNLFLYIPPTSAHSPGVLKSIIFGNVHRYWYQNSNIDDYQYII